ncbi:MAG: hypothetical protein V4736_02530, partial [Bdellovibrionota bacterium]
GIVHNAQMGAGVGAIAFVPGVVGAPITGGLSLVAAGAAVVLGAAGGALYGVSNKLDYSNYLATYTLLQEARRGNGPNITVLAQGAETSVAKVAGVINSLNDSNSFCEASPMKYRDVLRLVGDVLDPAADWR